MWSFDTILLAGAVYHADEIKNMTFWGAVALNISGLMVWLCPWTAQLARTMRNNRYLHTSGRGAYASVVYVLSLV